jgi:hypothetical protein
MLARMARGRNDIDRWDAVRFEMAASALGPRHASQSANDRESACTVRPLPRHRNKCRDRVQRVRRQGAPRGDRWQDGSTNETTREAQAVARGVACVTCQPKLAFRRSRSGTGLQTAAWSCAIGTSCWSNGPRFTASRRSPRAASAMDRSCAISLRRWRRLLEGLAHAFPIRIGAPDFAGKSAISSSPRRSAPPPKSRSSGDCH